MFGPYQVAKMQLEPKIKSQDPKYELDDLVMAFMKVFENTFNKELQVEKDVAGEKAYAGIGYCQFKGQCVKCGNYGHKAQDC